MKKIRIKEFLHDPVKTTGMLSVLLFAVGAYLLLLGCYSLYIAKIEGLTLYLGTSYFYDSCMQVPGGGVAWLSAYLTQFFYHPAVGALVIVLLLAAIQVLVIKAFSIPARYAPLSVVVPAVLLLCFTNLGYLIFTLEPNGYALSLPVGVLAALALYYVYTRLHGWILQSIYIPAVVVLCYHLLGFYALLAAMMCALSCILSPRQGHFRLQLLPLLTGLMAVYLFPKWWYAHYTSELMPSRVYISALPYFFSHETGIKTLYSIAFIALSTGAFFSPVLTKLNRQTDKKLCKWVLCLWLAMMVMVGACRYSDRDFNLTLQLDKALWDQDWQKAADIATGIQQPTTRVNTVLSYVALMRTGQAADRMFAISYGWEPYNTTRGGSAFNDAASYLLCYHLGLPNYAYRWGTEYSVAQAMSPERLKILAKCALLNYDLALAKTYLDILYNMPNHRAWAEKYLQYQKDPMKMSADPEFAMLIPLMCHYNEFINDGGAIEGYVWPMLARATGGTPQFEDLTMQAALICRDLDTFVAKLPSYLQTHRSLPVHYQEAALLWAKLGRHPYPAPISSQVEQRHEAFLQAFRNYSQMEAETQRENMRKAFGNTYWFYFVFDDDKMVK